MGIEQSISSIVNSPAFEPSMGAGLGFMAGGPAGAGMGAMLGSGNKNLQAMAPLIPGAAQALGMSNGMGMGAPQSPQQIGPPPMQRPMPAPQQLTPNVIPQPLPPIAGRQRPQLPSQVAQVLGLG